MARTPPLGGVARVYRPGVAQGASDGTGAVSARTSSSTCWSRSIVAAGTAGEIHAKPIASWRSPARRRPAGRSRPARCARSRSRRLPDASSSTASMSAPASRCGAMIAGRAAARPARGVGHVDDRRRRGCAARDRRRLPPSDRGGAGPERRRQLTARLDDGDGAALERRECSREVRHPRTVEPDHAHVGRERPPRLRIDDQDVRAGVGARGRRGRRRVGGHHEVGLRRVVHEPRARSSRSRRSRRRRARACRARAGSAPVPMRALDAGPEVGAAPGRRRGQDEQQRRPRRPDHAVRGK